MHRSITKKIIRKRERIKMAQRFKKSWLWCFSLYFCLTLLLLLYLHFFHIISFVLVSIFLDNLSNFFVFCWFCYLYVYVHYYPPLLRRDVTKKELFLLFSMCFIEDYRRLELLRSIFGNLSRAKLLLVHLQFLMIHYFDDSCFFVWRLSRCLSCLTLICINYKK